MPPTKPEPPRVRLSLVTDAAPFESAISELEGLFGAAPGIAAEFALAFFDGAGRPRKRSIARLFVVKSHYRPALGANHLAVRIEPTQALLGFMAALRAGNRDGDLVGQHLGCLLSGSPQPEDSSPAGAASSQGDAAPATPKPESAA